LAPSPDSPAEIALVGHVFLGKETHGPVGTGLHATLAPRAEIPIDDHHPVFFPFPERPGLGPAGPDAGRPFALVADLEDKLQSAPALFVPQKT